MTIEEVQKYLNQGEGLRVEFKIAGQGVPSSLYETIVSFSNRDGGIIILGATDDGEVIGIDPSRINQMYKDVVTTLNDRNSIDPPITLSPLPFSHPDGQLIVLQVPASSQIHRFAGKVYDREADADLTVTDYLRISDLYYRKRNFFTESQIYPALGFGDLDSELFIKARNLIRSVNSVHPWLTVSDEEFLRSSLLYRKDFLTGEEGFTLAAALIFGKDSTIQSLLPAYKVEGLVRRVNQDRWDDRVTLRTNLIDTYGQLMEFVRKHLPEKFYLEEDQRKDLRNLIFREIIGNLIVHREYTSHFSSELIITNDLVYTTNPNKAIFHGPLDLNAFSPYPKNPNIRKFFTAFGWTDEIGSGVRNTKKYVNIYVPGAKPQFIENTVFRAEVPLITLNMGMLASYFYEWLGLHEESASHVMRGLADISLPVSLKNTSFADLILYLVPSWHRNGTKIDSLDWPNKQISEPEFIKLVPRFDINGTGLLHKKVTYLIKVLLYTSSPISMDRLMFWIGYQNRKRFRDNYIRPLQEASFIRMTIPDTPSDPKQQYIITEKGRQFLAGFDL